MQQSIYKEGLPFIQKNYLNYKKYPRLIFLLTNFAFFQPLVCFGLEVNVRN